MTPIERQRVEHAAIVLLGLARQSAAATGRKGDKAQRLRLLVAAAERELACRRDRALVFEALHFTGDAGWDILLELYLARAAGTRLYVTAIGVEAGIPQTTVLRWLGLMESEKFVQRAADSHDRRRQWIELTRTGQSLMERYLEGRLGDTGDAQESLEGYQNSVHCANDRGLAIST